MYLYGNIFPFDSAYIIGATWSSSIDYITWSYYHLNSGYDQTQQEDADAKKC